MVTEWAATAPSGDQQQPYRRFLSVCYRTPTLHDNGPPYLIFGEGIVKCELLSRVVYGGSRGALLHPEPILKGHTLHDLCQVMRGP